VERQRGLGVGCGPRTEFTPEHSNDRSIFSALQQQLVPGECTASPLGYRSGDTASGKKLSQGLLVFGELPQAGLDDAFSPIKELVDRGDPSSIAPKSRLVRWLSVNSSQ
jgi:hypothetical protein